MRVIVIGGHGFLGSRAVRALARAEGVEVIVAGRRARKPGDRVVDLADAATFAALDDADVIVNASSSHGAAPDRVAAYCLERGLTMIEASSDRVVVERLLDAHRTSAAKGTLVLGAGIFTGVSNAMAGEAARGLPDADELAIGVRHSPFSGAGAGTVDLMADVLAVSTHRIRGGQRVEGPSVSRGPTLPFLEGESRTIHAPFPEPAMAHASTGIADVTMSMAPRPAILATAFLALPAALLRMRAFQAFMRIYFRLLRRVLLGSVVTRVGIVARARHRASGRERVIALSTPDGFRAAGVAIAATVLAVGRGATRRGCFVVDELVPLRAMLDGMRALDPPIVIETKGLENEKGPEDVVLGASPITR